MTIFDPNATSVWGRTDWVTYNRLFECTSPKEGGRWFGGALAVIQPETDDLWEVVHRGAGHLYTSRKHQDLLQAFEVLLGPPLLVRGNPYYPQHTVGDPNQVYYNGCAPSHLRWVYQWPAGYSRSPTGWASRCYPSLEDALLETQQKIEQEARANQSLVSTQLGQLYHQLSRDRQQVAQGQEWLKEAL